MKRRFSSILACAAAFGLSCASGYAVPQSLLSNSPFQPSGAGPAVAPTVTGRLELRGILTLGGKPRFTIVDTSNNRAVWLAVGETDGGIRVSGFDAANDIVAVELDGQMQSLKMKEAQIVSVAVAQPPPNVPGMAPVPPGTSAAAVPAGSEAEIQARRNKIIEELRRRRALRKNPPGTQ